MTFAIMLTLNIVLAVAILGALVFVMTRPARLRPHGPVARARPGRRVARERTRGERTRSPLRALLD
jgi:hypothetical protein